MFSENIGGVKGLGRLFNEYWKPYFFGLKPFLIETQTSGDFLARPRSQDPYVIQEVAVNEQYRPSEDIGDINTAVDFGANIGTASVWLARTYDPNLLVAVELERENFALLIKNLSLNGLEGRAVAINKALFSHDGKVGVKIQTFHSGHHMVHLEKPNAALDAVSLRTLMSQNGLARIDFMKMDIEGGEDHVLTEQNAQIFREQVRYVHMESHGPEQGGLDVQRAVQYLTNLGYKTKTRPTPFPGALMVEAFNPRILENTTR